MSKKLTPLQAFNSINGNPNISLICDRYFREERYVVENALKELEDLQKVLDDFGIYNIQNLIDTLKNIAFLETDFLGQSQELNIKNKALEIIKDKKVDVQMLYDRKNLNEYNWCVHEKVRALTQEEYDLLKEELL